MYSPLCCNIIQIPVRNKFSLLSYREINSTSIPRSLQNWTSTVNTQINTTTTMDSLKWEGKREVWQISSSSSPNTWAFKKQNIHSKNKKIKPTTSSQFWPSSTHSNCRHNNGNRSWVWAMNMYALLFWKSMLPEKEWTPVERLCMWLTERFFKHESVSKADVLIWLISRFHNNWIMKVVLTLQNKQMKCR